VAEIEFLDTLLVALEAVHPAQSTVAGPSSIAKVTTFA
jgi:hypothetical protein